MNALRSGLANVLVGIAVFLAAFWFLRIALRALIGVATFGALVAVVVVLLGLAARLRRPGG